MRISQKINKTFVLTIAIIVVFSGYCSAQTSQTRHGSFLSVNGDISGGHQISQYIEQGATTSNSPETLGNLNLGWFNYWNHLSAEVQFTVSPFISSLSNPRTSIRATAMQFWFGYSVFENDVVSVSPALGFGTYNFRASTGSATMNAHLMLGAAGEVFIPESRIMLGLRAGYQHNFVFVANENEPIANAGGAVVQVRTGIRLF